MVLDIYASHIFIAKHDLFFRNIIVTVGIRSQKESQTSSFCPVADFRSTVRSSVGQCLPGLSILFITIPHSRCVHQMNCARRIQLCSYKDLECWTNVRSGGTWNFMHNCPLSSRKLYEHANLEWLALESTCCKCRYGSVYRGQTVNEGSLSQKKSWRDKTFKDVVRNPLFEK